MASKSKIVKKGGEAPTEIEKRVSQEMVALEASNETLKATLKNVHFSAAKEVELDGGKKAVIVFVPPPLLGDYRKIQKTLVEELEKKLGAPTLIIANRTMMGPASYARSTKTTGVRPRSRTLRAVQEALLDDLVFPTEIVGKRTRVKMDGSRLLKVLFSAKDAVAAEGKTDVYRSVFKKLTNKDIAFEFTH